MAVSGTTPMLASRTPMYSEVAASRSIPRVCLGGLVDGGSGCCDVLSGSCWLLAWILRQACSKLAAILRQSCGNLAVPKLSGRKVLAPQASRKRSASCDQ